MELDCVSHPYYKGQDEDEACTSPGFHQRPVEVQGPALRLDLGWRELGPHPLSHKIGEDMGFYGLLRLVGDSITHEFYNPFCNSAISFSVLDHLSQRDRQDHRDWVRLKVMAELAPG